MAEEPKDHPGQRALGLGFLLSLLSFFPLCLPTSLSTCTLSTADEEKGKNGGESYL